MVNIRQLREVRGLKQNELATTIGVSQQLLSMIERGNRRVTIDVARKLAPILGVNWYELIDGEEESA